MNIAAVFLAAGAGMILEIALGRSVGPFLGTSTEVWAAVIAVTLAGLAIGAWAGGKISDRVSPATALAASLAFATAAAAIGAAARDVAAAAGLLVAAETGSLFTGAALTTALVTGHASLLIGAVGPIATRRALESPAPRGQVLGNLSAAGAAGSVVGTVAAGAFLLPTFGAADTFTVAVATLAVGALAVAPRAAGFWRHRARTLAIVGLAIAWAAPGSLAGVTADIDTRYSRAIVSEQRGDDGRPIRTVLTDPFSSQCAAYVDEQPGPATSSLPFRYTRWLTVYDDLAAPADAPILVIGGCNLSLPRHLAARGVEVDVFEIDPGMTEIAENFFGFGSRPTDVAVRVSHGDARVLLAAADDGAYRAIVVDAFGGSTGVPPHLASAEFFRLARQKLRDDGALAMNVVGGLEGDAGQVTAAILAAARESFPEAAALHGDAGGGIQNIVLVAGPRGAGLADAAARHGLAIADERLLPNLPALTDDLAPTDQLTAPNREAFLRALSG